MKHPRDLSPESSNKLQKRDIDASTNQIRMLLDFSSLSSHREISEQFDKLAESIFHEYTLCAHVCDDDDDIPIEYEILELEFYLYKSDCHPDPFTHQSDEQKRTGEWYFHRAPTSTRSGGSTRETPPGYRGGTRKGLDLTFGHPITSQYFCPPEPSSVAGTFTRGGILLRTIRRLTPDLGKIISGPSLLVDEILAVNKADSISDLVHNKWSNDTKALLPPLRSGGRVSPSLYLKKRPQRMEPCVEIYRTPRIGLELSHPSTTASPADPRIIYISKPYRYIIYPNLLTSNGRCQTFLGVYRTCCLDSCEDETSLAAKVAQITAIREKNVAKYIVDFKHGSDGRCSLGSFVGTKHGSASVSKYLQMMGALQALQNSAPCS